MDLNEDQVTLLLHLVNCSELNQENKKKTKRQKIEERLEVDHSLR